MIGYVKQAATNSWQAVERASVRYISKDIIILAKRVYDTAMRALLASVATILFAHYTPFFLLGFSIGVLNTDKMDGMLADIATAWHHLLYENENRMRLGLMTVLSIYSWNVSIMMSAFFLGGYYGADLQHPVPLPQLRPDPNLLDTDAMELP
ncbi:MAG: hypothetical protein JWO53_844 [Chlamydiia bacterium]|nr:hypothetical protein [Chlamydiia bacterium]